jgi:hypothetical protein
VAASCSSWEYSYCSPQNLNPDLTTTVTEGEYTSSIRYLPSIARSSGCGCYSQTGFPLYNVGTTIFVKATMASSNDMTCNVAMTASYAAYCLNGGRWQSTYCLCPEEYTGDQCESSINDPNRVSIRCITRRL